MKNSSIKEMIPLKNDSVIKTIAVVDDEPDILELVTVNLEKAGYKVKSFLNAGKFFDYLKNNSPDMIVLDLMLPDADGFEICKYLKNEKKYSNIPVLMLTARGEETDKVLGLELGADDYVTKPFSPRELSARIKAILRRDENKTVSNTIHIGGILVIDLDKYETFLNDKKVDLTLSEFKILTLLSSRRGWVYSREQILEHLGTQMKGVLDRTVDVHIKNLREKIGEAGKYVKNIRGIGYKLEVNE